MADKKANQDPSRASNNGGQNTSSGPSPAPVVDADSPEGSETAIPTLTRFRLPRFFSQGAEEAPAPEISEEVAIAELPDDPVKTPLTPGVPVTAIGRALANGGNSRNGKNAPATSQQMEEDDTVALSAADFSALIERVAVLTDQIREVNDRESAMERVFNTLHSELADYKNDFLYEHLKPVVRPLLFLFDSLEQFDGEVAVAESSLAEAGGAQDTTSVLSAPVVRENVHYFRDQLVEALRVCEVVLMDPPSGAFNSKFHKAVDVLPVAQEEDGQIMRVVRAGWFLNGQLLRPAEVVVGKFRAQS